MGSPILSRKLSYLDKIFLHAILQPGSSNTSNLIALDIAVVILLCVLAFSVFVLVDHIVDVLFSLLADRPTPDCDFVVNARGTGIARSYYSMKTLEKLLLRVRYRSGNNGSSNGACAICLEEFADEEMCQVLPKCTHMYHLECIESWLNNHQTCPICRACILEEG